MRKRYLLMAGAVLTLGILASQAPRLFADTPPAQPSQAKAAAKAPAAAPVALPQPGKPGFLTPQQVHGLMQAGVPVRIGDVRKANAYERRHIQGALSLPRKEIKTWGPKLSKEELLVLYCS